MPLRLHLRSRLDHLRVTSVEKRYSLGFDGAVVLGPRLAWGARLVEFECVEVRNLARCTRVLAHVLIGSEGDVQIWDSKGLPAQPGDELRITAFAWLPPDKCAEHSATLVRVGRNNTPIEIREAKARVAKIDPSYFPLPPREEKVSVWSENIPSMAAD